MSVTLAYMAYEMEWRANYCVMQVTGGNVQYKYSKSISGRNPAVVPALVPQVDPSVSISLLGIGCNSTEDRPCHASNIAVSQAAPADALKQFIGIEQL